MTASEKRAVRKFPRARNLKLVRLSLSLRVVMNPPMTTLPGLHPIYQNWSRYVPLAGGLRKTVLCLSILSGLQTLSRCTSVLGIRCYSHNYCQLDALLSLPSWGLDSTRILYSESLDFEAMQRTLTLKGHV